MGGEQLQGEPWHYEQAKKTCKEGSKYCVYNKKNICFNTASDTYKDSCTGKGICMLFEPKTGKPKIYSTKRIQNNDVQQKDMEERNMENMQNQNNDKAENFVRLASNRTDKIIKDIELLGKLANKNQYEYTDEQVEKIFDAIESILSATKEGFKKKKPIKKFSL